MKFNKDNFRQIRKEKRISLKKVTSQIGKSYRTLLAWEKGERNPGESDIRILAQLLNIRVSEISDLKDLTTSNTSSYHHSLGEEEQFFQDASNELSTEKQASLLKLKNELKHLTEEVKKLKKMNDEQKSIIDSFHAFIKTKEKEAEDGKRILHEIIDKFEGIVWVGGKNKKNNADFQLHYINSKACEDMIGFTDAELINDPGIWGNIIYSEDHNRIIAEFATNKYPRESLYRIIHRNNDVKYVKDIEYRINDDLYFGFVKDVSNDLHNLELLEYFKDSVNHLNGVFWIKQILPEEKIIFMADAIEKIIGFSAKDLTTEFWYSRILDEDLSRVEKAYKRHTEKKIPLVYKIKNKDGSIHTVDEVWFDMQEKNPKTIKFGFIRDTSE